MDEGSRGLEFDGQIFNLKKCYLSFSCLVFAKRPKSHFFFLLFGVFNGSYSLKQFKFNNYYLNLM